MMRIAALVIGAAATALAVAPKLVSIDRFYSSDSVSWLCEMIFCSSFRCLPQPWQLLVSQQHYWRAGHHGRRQLPISPGREAFLSRPGTTMERLPNG